MKKLLKDLFNKNSMILFLIFCSIFCAYRYQDCLYAGTKRTKTTKKKTTYDKYAVLKNDYMCTMENIFILLRNFITTHNELEIRIQNLEQHLNIPPEEVVELYDRVSADEVPY